MNANMMICSELSLSKVKSGIFESCDAGVRCVYVYFSCLLTKEKTYFFSKIYVSGETLCFTLRILAHAHLIAFRKQYMRNSVLFYIQTRDSNIRYMYLAYRKNSVLGKR